MAFCNYYNANRTIRIPFPALNQFESIIIYDAKGCVNARRNEKREENIESRKMKRGFSEVRAGLGFSRN
jgi:hypothetical protein